MTADTYLRKQGRPNVVLLVIDCGRPDHFSSYGYYRPTTPVIDSLAGNGLLFERAYTVDTASPLTHFALMTGQRDWEGRAWLKRSGATGRAWFLYRRVLRRLGVTDFVGGYDPARHSLLSHLKRAGYFTVGLSANQLISPSTANAYRGFDQFPEEQLFAGLDRDPVVAKRLKHYAIKDTKANRQAVYLTADRVMGLARQTIETHDPDLKRPFFLFMNVMDCHDPYLVHPDFKPDFGFKPTVKFNGDLRNRKVLEKEGQSERRWVFADDIDPATVDLLRWNYDRCLGYVDSQVGVLVDWLKAKQAFEDTVFIILADHAEYLGERGRFGHSMEPTEEQLHIPLIVSGGDYVQAGERVKWPVSIVDIRPTIFNLLGLSDNFVHRSGQSLLAPRPNQERRPLMEVSENSTSRKKELMGAQRGDVSEAELEILEERLRDLGYLD